MKKIMKGKSGVIYVVLGLIIASVSSFLVYDHVYAQDVNDYIPWTNGDSVCSDLIMDGYRSCDAIINITNPLLESLNNLTFYIDDNGYPLEYYVFDPHYVDKYTKEDCPDKLVAGVCSWKDNGTIIWEQEQILKEWRQFDFDEGKVEQLMKHVQNFNLPPGESIQVRIVGKKEVGADAKWTICIGSAYCIDPLWSDPAGDAQGWYNFPNEFNIRPLAASNANDWEWYNRTDAGFANMPGGSGLRHDDGGVCTESQGAFAYVWRSGFSEGTYSLHFTGLAQSNYNYENITIAPRRSDGTWTNFTFGFDGTGNIWHGNTSINAMKPEWGGHDGFGIPVYVNSSGMLEFLLWANGTNCAVGYYVAIGALNVTNFTASADTTDPSAIAITTPANNTVESQAAVTIKGIFTEANPDTCVFEVSNITSNKINYSNTSTGSGDCTFDFTFATGDVNATLFVNDTAGNNNHTPVSPQIYNFTVVVPADTCTPPTSEGADWYVNLNDNCTKVNGETKNLGTLRIYGTGGFFYLNNYNVTVINYTYNQTGENGGIIVGNGSRMGRTA